MKKLVLSFLSLSLAFINYGQVVVAGVSPAAIAGNYPFGVQSHQGWPGQAGDGTWNLSMDFNVPGTFVQDTLMLVEDGSPGTNPQGNPVSQEGCSALTNNLTGKIAVVYRNTCEFGTKVLNAQNAGAVAVIIINREPQTNFTMLGGVDGINTNIPAVFMSNTDGQILTTQMQSGPVVMFIGNKLSAFNNDVASDPAAALISKYGGADNNFFDGFDTGIEIYNHGANTQSNVMVYATIQGPSGVVYSDSVGPINMNSGDTVSIFNGNTYSFNTYDLGGPGNYPTGDYTLTYDIDLGVADDFPFDNILSSMHTITSSSAQVLSLATINSSGIPNATNYPSNSTTEYSSCMFLQDLNVTGVLDAVTFVPYTDTAVNNLAGAEIFINVFQWNDNWVDLNDPNYVGGANNDWFQSLQQIGVETHYPSANTETGQPVTVTMSSPVTLTANQRYLVCLQTFDPVIAFGYDNALDYDANQAITAMPISPVNVDATWYTGGWIGSSAPSISLNIFPLGINENNLLSAKAFPNPTTGLVSIEADVIGDAIIKVFDISGKEVMFVNESFENGTATMNLSELNAGTYILDVEFENGEKAHVNIVKQ